ncbi:MAG: phosphoglycerate dehydrogenase [Oscillospiraceae bacterium]|nr:phosphoglycerate dehydrogenase [Oscillospiraceae bacterium]
MYQIKLLNKISPAGLDQLDKGKYKCSSEIENPDAIMVRSASMHEMEMPESLKAIARAGAGTNNIPVDQCAEKGIVVFNTPGANANAVKELVIAGLFLASRKIVPAIEWAATLKGQGAEVGKLVEKGKGQFAGPEITGKKLGVIGLGAIGILVANTAHNLGMDVYGYDPYISVDAAWGLSRAVKHAAALKDIFTECDYITIHVPLTPETKGMVSSESIAMMKKGVRILNFARADLVSSADMIEALANGSVGSYVTDFPTDELLGVEGVVAIPHLGASTPESEDNCAKMAALEIVDFLENGNIKNSVNYPTVVMPRTEHARICVAHKNVPATITQITNKISELGINIEAIVNKSKKDYAYTMLDINDKITDQLVESVSALDGIIRVFVFD